jgi:hypothetical protein
VSISIKVRIHESQEEFFAREGLYEKNKNGELVPGYLIITPLGDRWISCSECSAISLDGYPISMEIARNEKSDSSKRRYGDSRRRRL